MGRKCTAMGRPRWLVVVLLAQIVWPSAIASQSMVMGKRLPGDQLILGYTLYRLPVPFKVQRKTITFPEALADRGPPISMIEVQNKAFRLLSYSDFTITTGGVGHDHVEMKFKSVIGMPLHYSIKIYINKYDNVKKD